MQFILKYDNLPQYVCICHFAKQKSRINFISDLVKKSLEKLSQRYKTNFAFETFQDSLNYTFKGLFKQILSHCGICSNQTYDHAVNRSPRKVSKPQIDSKQFRTCKTLLQGQILNPVNGIILIIRGINVQIVSDACGPKKHALQLLTTYNSLYRKNIVPIYIYRQYLISKIPLHWDW